MKKIFLLLILILVSFNSYSLPRFALKTGGMCIDCHTNPTGGNLRHSDGWSYGRNVLPLISPGKDFTMSNALNENILFGFDFRGQYLALFREGSSRSDFQRMTGSVYSSIGISEQIDLLARYDFIWGIWEAYAVARILPNDSYIKAGSFTPNFGIRLDDHTAYTRGGDLGIVTSRGMEPRGLIYDPRYTETGAEIGINLSDFGLFTGSVGTSSQQLFTRDPSYTASLQFNAPLTDEINFTVGTSGAIFKTMRFTPAFTVEYPEVKMYGFFGGVGIGNISLIGEFDFAYGYLRKDTRSTALMVEASYIFIKGIEAVVRYDRFDPYTLRNDDDLSRFIFGFEFHPYNFIEIRPQYRVQMETPAVKNNLLLIQFHFWY
jgi:hypothetical protein